jgi:hypothetical protein
MRSLISDGLSKEFLAARKETAVVPISVKRICYMPTGLKEGPAITARWRLGPHRKGEENVAPRQAGGAPGTSKIKEEEEGNDKN